MDPSQQHQQPAPLQHPLPPQPPKRRKSLLLPILLVGMFVLMLVFLLGISFLVLSFRSGPEPVSVTSGSVLSLKVEGAIDEYRPPTPFEGFFGSPALQFHDYLSVIDRAGRDNRIDGIHLKVGFTNMNWAQVQDLRASLRAFREQGKWVIAYGELWTEMEYYLASAADEIYMSDECVIWLDGLSSSTTYYGDLLKEYGVGVHVEAKGDYKSFADSYRYGGMSDAHREATDALLNSLLETFTADVAAARELEPSAVRTALDESVYTVDEGVERGFLTGKLYPDQVRARMAEKLGVSDSKKVRLIPALNYQMQNRGGSGGDKIAVLYAVGAIQSGASSVGLFGTTAVGSDQFIKDLRAARRDSSVKAIVVRIDSPGGTALASDLIWRELRLAVSDGKPVIASMGNVAASGGYYLAMACDEIYAQETTITGSIGVVSMRFSLQGLYDKAFLNMDTVKTGPSADFFDMYRPLTEQEVEDWRRRTEASYNQFVSKAATSRGKEFTDVEPFARGRVWSGLDAKKHGLIDHLGGLQNAIDAAADKADLTRYRVVRYPREDTSFEQLLGGSNVHSRLPEAVTNLLPAELRLLADIAASASDGSRGGISDAARMQTLVLHPFSLEIR